MEAGDFEKDTFLYKSDEYGLTKEDKGNSI